ncbi:hypothetical protein [Melioribacter sp. OK-6-Me]|uniref:hypothetical protein n=1 Tax=unclassified Melioribacter TaxID=2627329 RepID=UPI003EDB4068
MILKFKNGINGTLETWSPPAKIYNLGSVKRRIESRNPGEAGVIVYDKLNLTLEYENGSPVYAAFSGDLSAAQRYIFEFYGVKTDKSASKLFEGLCDFSTIEWADNEKKIRFNVIDKISALSIIANVRKQREEIQDAVNLRSGYAGQYGIGISKVNLSGVGECYALPTWTVVYINYTASKGTPIAHNNLILEKGDIFQHPNIGYYDNYGIFHEGLGKFIVTDSGFTNFNGVQTTWIKVYNPPSNFEYDPPDWEDFIPQIKFYAKKYYDMDDICYYGIDGYGRTVVTGFNGIKIIEAIYELIWGNSTVINKVDPSGYPIALDYYEKTIDENPFGHHPLDALKMLAASIQCYIYVNKTGDLVLHKKSNITNNPIRTIVNMNKKNGNKKLFWDKLVDAVTVTVNSGKLIDGQPLAGTATVKKYAGIEPRNELKLEIVAPNTVEMTQQALDLYAANAASDVMNFYGKRHYYYNLTARLTDDMYDWELLDQIDIDGERYFIQSAEIDEARTQATFELVSVTGYDYDFEQARAVMSKEKYNSSSTGVSSSSANNVIINQNILPLRVKSFNYTMLGQSAIKVIDINENEIVNVITIKLTTPFLNDTISQFRLYDSSGTLFTIDKIMGKMKTVLEPGQELTLKKIYTANDTIYLEMLAGGAQATQGEGMILIEKFKYEAA